jgi:LuxR family transcriptional regulator, maltose regulon positive regulatory protein
MGTSAPASSPPPQRTVPAPLPFELPLGLPASKLQRPPIRPGIIWRTRPLAQIEAAGPVSVISIVAPPGYGKSTLLTQWAAGMAASGAWISCDAGDNDPAVLLTCLAVAFAQVGAIDPLMIRTAGQSAAITAVPTLMEAMRPQAHPSIIALDHLEEITDRECHDILTEFILRLPPGWQVAMASRHALPLPVARLRTQGRILEIGARDLAMTVDETRSLLADAGIPPAAASAEELVGGTEGWPIGVYLSSLWLKRGTHRTAEPGIPIVERSVTDYLRAEILDQTSDDELTFLTRTSLLPRMCGALCDETVGRGGSGRLLEQLEQRNLLVVPLDRHRTWYRYHRLLQELLEAELRHREPDIVPLLHARAAAWFEANGLADEAIEQAQMAGDSSRVARLVLDRMQPVWASGRVDTVLNWVTWFEREELLGCYPEIALHGALLLALLGRAEEAERWAAIAEQAAPETLASDGSTMRGLLAYLRAILARDGVEAMRRDARVGLAELAPTSPYRATMLYTEGLADLLDGHAEHAEPILGYAVDVAIEMGALPLAALVLAERCIAAGGRGDWTPVSSNADRAASMVDAGGFEDYWTSALVYAWAARAALHRGDPAAAQRHAAQAARLRPLLVYSIPVVPVQALLELTGVYIGLGDPGGADAALRQAEDILRERPQLGVLQGQARRLRARVEHVVTDPAGTSSLTTAELRLLPLLRTHLSLAQIGERLHVSRSTVKTQTKSVYRKLSVSSRSEAVSRSRELGLDLS